MSWSPAGMQVVSDISSRCQYLLLGVSNKQHKSLLVVPLCCASRLGSHLNSSFHCH
jgi:hypothetical protein